jgi:phospholipid transport system substrate-binding protein
VRARSCARQAPPVKVDWRLIGRNGAYKISDVSVDGISMAVTQRSEFASVIQHNGGQVQGLITMLRERPEAALRAKSFLFSSAR